MMHKLSCFLIMLLVLTLGFTACKGDTEDQKKEITREVKSSREIPRGDFLEKNKEANGILEYRYKTQGKESYAAIEMDRWYYLFKATGSDIKPVVDGSWIDFYPDMSYEYGDQEGIMGRGRYHYTPESGIVLLIDNNTSVKPREYEAKIVGPSMIFVGQATYGDNWFQCKLEMDHVDRDKSAQ